MDLLNQLINSIRPLIPSSLAVLAIVLAFVLIHVFLRRRWLSQPGLRFRYQITMLLLSLVTLLAVVLALPMSEVKTGQLLSLIGIVLSAAIALSSTTFLGNMLAGFMQRAVKSFRPGDFVRIENHFGRVSEQGLFHVEIQTEDRDLTTLPNLYMATHPVKVIRASGTLITAEVSLGYDVERGRIEARLVEAANAAGLEEPFVYVMALGDFSVTYRVAGMLKDITTLLSTRSRLRQMMLDQLHGDGIEIVSPTFMNQRQFPLEQTFIPPVVAPAAPEPVTDAPESRIFDKADEAANRTLLEDQVASAKERIQELKGRLGQATDDTERADLQAEIEKLTGQVELLSAELQRQESGDKKSDG